MSNLANFEFVAIDITRKNYLYWILNVEIYLDAMGLGNVIKEINKVSDQLICSYNNIIMRRDFTNILNLFDIFLWLNKTKSFFIENHETFPIGSCITPSRFC